MRVIHEDGRIGTTSDMPGWPCFNVEWDNVPWPQCWQVVGSAYLRPLGPIEEELRKRSPILLPIRLRERMSECIEACERIYQQTGEVM